MSYRNKLSAEEWGAIVALLIIVAAVGGWIANIVKFIHAVNDPLTALEIIRVIGVFAAPLGAILGYL